MPRAGSPSCGVYLRLHPLQQRTHARSRERRRRQHRRSAAGGAAVQAAAAAAAAHRATVLLLLLRWQRGRRRRLLRPLLQAGPQWIRKAVASGLRRVAAAAAGLHVCGAAYGAAARGVHEGAGLVQGRGPFVI